jgi:DNA repair exonuclease SbcCD nuclease subunit
MERIRNRPDAILSGDWHLREETPICRTDNFWETQWKKVDFISALQEKYDCPVLHSGDLFNSWKPSPYLLAATIEHLPKQFFTVFGNHDLPQHNLELANKCGINVLEKAGCLSVLEGVHWGQIPTEHGTNSNYSDILTSRRILVWHVMTYTGKIPWPDCPDPKAESLLRKYFLFDLILTGHNHQSFVAKHEGRILVNPGGITRQTADQFDHQPCVYLWFADTNTVTPVYLPIQDGVVIQDHLLRKQERDNRLEAFVSRLNNEWEGAVSFEENVERMLVENQIRESVKQIVYKAIET